VSVKKEIKEDIKDKETVLKGRVGEALVRELFLMLGMDVYFNGVEHKFPSLAAKHLKGRAHKNIVLRHIANAPDFVIVDTRKEKDVLYYVEVKFRSRGEINSKELLRYEEGVIFILLDKSTFYVVEREFIAKEYAKGVQVKFRDLSMLSQKNVFDLDSQQKQTVVEYANSFIPLYLSGKDKGDSSG